MHYKSQGEDIVIKLMNSVSEIDEDICHQPMDPGTGDSPTVMYYFSAEVEGCQEFTYNGEGGNSNRFSSPEDCNMACTNMLIPSESHSALKSSVD